MNRDQRRAIARIARSHNPSRMADPIKGSYKLPPQTCVLWAPELCGYVVEFCPHHVSTVEYAEFAKHFDEDEAASMAIAFREVTGFRVAVRPFYCHHTEH